MIKSVIFDLDGTLIDSMPVWYNVDRIFLAENGHDYPPDVSEAVRKMRIEESSVYFKDRFKLPHSQEYIINRIEELVREQYEYKIPVKPYVNELLDFLDEKNIPYGIATSTYKSLAVMVLTRLGIYDRFRFLMTCSEISSGKTEPLIYLKSAELLGTEPSQTAVFEDSLHCIETASAAGFYTAAVYDESSADEWDSIVKISDISFMNLKNASDIFQGGH